MMDIGLLMFNLGRCDFRAKHLVPHIILVQGSVRSGVETTQEAFEVSNEMFQSIGALIEMRGLIRLSESLLDSPAWVKREDSAGRLTKGTIWCTFKTLLAHRCWRRLPGLTRHLPHVLLGGNLQGVDLQSGEFDEPLPKTGPNKSVKPPPPPCRTIAARKGRDSEKRRTRYAQVYQAIDMLIRWALLERKNFLTRVVGVCPGEKTELITEHDDMAMRRKDMMQIEEVCNNKVMKALLVDMDDEEESQMQHAQKPEAMHRPTPQKNTKPNMQRPALGSKKEKQHTGQTGKPTTLGKDLRSAEISTCEGQKGNGVSAMSKTVLDSVDLLVSYPAHSDAVEDLATECKQMFQLQTPTTFVRDVLEIVGPLPACGWRSLDDEDEDEDVADEGCEEHTLSEEALSSGQAPPRQNLAHVDIAKCWVIRRGVDGRIMFSPSQAKKDTEYSSAGTREQFLAAIGRVFGGRTLFTTCEPLVGSSACRMVRDLAMLHKEFDGKLWALEEEVVRRCVRDPPPEVFGTCTFEEFFNEYARFCKWVQDLDSKPYSCEFFTLRGCQVVQVQLANGSKVPNVFFYCNQTHRRSQIMGDTHPAC
jgi:hypothetical protein